MLPLTVPLKELLVVSIVQAEHAVIVTVGLIGVVLVKLTLLDAESVRLGYCKLVKTILTVPVLVEAGPTVAVTVQLGEAVPAIPTVPLEQLALDMPLDTLHA
jgi:hypothetical protein